MTVRPGFVGLKLAHPHTCLPFDGPIMAAIVDAVNQSDSRIRIRSEALDQSEGRSAAVSQSESRSIWVHTGTTPFCPGGLYAARPYGRLPL